MKTTTTRHSLLAALLFCGPAFAGEADDGWSGLRERSLRRGVPSEQVETTVAGCRRNGLSARQAEALLDPVCAAVAAGLPPECVSIRIEEGLAKQVEPERIAAVAAGRLDCLRRANGLVAGAGAQVGGDQRRLVQHVCVALESGLPDAVLSAVLNRPGGYRYGRMIHVVEAAETLHLAGLDPADTQQVMNDFLDRDLNRAEIARVVEMVVSEKAKGRDFAAIRAELWVSSGD